MIYIPASALTIRLINQDYPSIISGGVLSPPRRHFISDMLLSQGGNDFISVQIDTLCYRLPIADHLGRDPFFIGNQLHKWAIDCMCRFIDTHAIYIGTWGAAKKFIQTYQLDDDEYSIETAFRTYNRWNNRRTAAHPRTDAPPCVSPVRTPCLAHPQSLLPLQPFTSDLHPHTPLHITNLAGAIIRDNLQHFYTNRGIFMYRKVRSLTRYLMYFHFGYLHSEIATFHRCTYKAVATSIHNTARFISSHRSIQKSISDLAS